MVTRLANGKGELHFRLLHLENYADASDVHDIVCLRPPDIGLDVDDAAGFPILTSFGVFVIFHFLVCSSQRVLVCFNVTTKNPQ